MTECLPGVFEVAAGEPDGVCDQVCWAISALRSGLGESCCGAQWRGVAGSPTDGPGPIARDDALAEGPNPEQTVLALAVRPTEPPHGIVLYSDLS